MRYILVVILSGIISFAGAFLGAYLSRIKKRFKISLEKDEVILEEQSKGKIEFLEEPDTEELKEIEQQESGWAKFFKGIK